MSAVTTERLEVKQIELDKLEPYWRNPRLNDGAVDAVVESIKQFGFNNPILVDSDLVIINGHTRFKAAKMLELKTVPCIVNYVLTAEQITAYRIIDNKTSEKAKWNKADLEAEIRASPLIISFQSYFPELHISPISLDTSLRPVTDAMIEADQHRLGDSFQGSGQRGARVQKIMCPHCGETFEVI